MLSDVWRLVSESTWVWWLTTLLLWGFIGWVAADWAGHRRLPAAVTSALLPLLGIAVLLIWNAAKNAGRPRGGIASPLAGSTSIGAQAGWQETGVAAPQAFFPAPRPAEGWDFLDDRGVGVPESARRSEATRSRPARVEREQTRVTLLAVGLAAAILAMTALFVGWFAVRPADNILGDYTGSSATLTAVPLVVTAGCLAAATTLYFRRPRRRWAVIAAFVAAPCLAISGQILVAAQALSSAAYRIVEKVGAPSDLSVRVHAGTYVLLIAGVLGMGWACLAAYWASAAHLPASGTTAVVGAGGDAQ